MKINVLFFGALKELLGRSAETVDFPPGAKASDVLLHYSGVPRFNEIAPSLAIAVNQEYAPPDRILNDNDEVGLLPPVSGGDGKPCPIFPGEVRIVHEPIDPEKVVAALKHAADGAVVTFDGIVRNQTRGRRTLHLDYEAYPAMALKKMEALAAEARVRFAVRGATIIHRLGRLQIGETSVLIVVAAAHRSAAFEACHWIIDTLKKTVPIWKKEYFEDGAVWADGDPFPEEIRFAGDTIGKPSAS